MPDGIVIYRFPRGERVGVPTLSRKQSMEWMVAAATNQLGAYLDRRGNLDITDEVLLANAAELGMDHNVALLHIQSYGRTRG